MIFWFVFTPAEFVTADEIIQGHKQLAALTRARGLKIFGGTLTPFGGFPLSSALKDEARQKVNDWIRSSGEYDAVIDFDEVLRDPAAPAQLQAIYDSGDHLHPNDAGYRRMAEAIDLKLFNCNQSNQCPQEARKN
jgi:lysophospholipase L1-like esterase